MNPPPDKRRRTEVTFACAESSELWGDEDEDFTDNQLEDIDNIVASQQVSHPPQPVQHWSRSKPQLTANHTAVTTHTQPHGRQSVQGSPQVNASHLTASHGTTSLTQRNTMVPKIIGKGTLKSRSTNDVLSQSHCVNNSDKQSGGHGFSHKSGDQWGAGIQNRSPLQDEREQLRKKLEEMEKVHMSLNGRVKILQGNVSQKEAELVRLRQEKTERLDTQSKEASEKEKVMSREIEWLKSELLFKEQEFISSERAASSKSSVTPIKPHTPNKAQSKQAPVSRHKTENSPSPAKVSRSAFPSTSTFLHDGCPRTPNKTDIQIAETSSKLPSRPRLQLKVNQSRGVISGSRLNEKLFLSRCVKPAISLTTGNTKFQTQQDSLSKSERALCASIQPSTSSSKKGVSSPSQQTQSWGGSSASADSCTVIDMEQISQHLLRTMQSLTHLNTLISARHALSRLETENGSVVFLVPVIRKSLSAYLDTLEGLRDTLLSATTQSTASQSLSTNPSGGGGGEAELVIMERQVCDHLRFLLCLVQNSQLVCQELVKEAVTCREENSRHTTTTDASNSKTQEGVRSPHTNSQTLLQLCSLANPAVSRSSPEASMICKYSLDILTVVVQSASPDSLEVLSGLPWQETLVHCLSNVENVRVKTSLALSVLSLLEALIQAKPIAGTLCGQDDCLLYILYPLCCQTSNVGYNSSTSIPALQQKLLQVLSTAVSCQKLGGKQLLHTDRECLCNEIIRPLVTMGHKSSRDMWELVSPATADMARQVTSLLQAIALSNKDSVESALETNPLHVQFAHRMMEFYRLERSGVSPLEKTITLDLWDWRHDSSEEDEALDVSQDQVTTRSDQSLMSTRPYSQGEPAPPSGHNQGKQRSQEVMAQAGVTADCEQADTLTSTSRTKKKLSLVRHRDTKN